MAHVVAPEQLPNPAASAARRRRVPSLRAIGAGLLALTPVLGGGIVIWGLPLDRPLGQPGVSLERPVTPTDVGNGVVSNSPVVIADPTDQRFVMMANRVDSPELGCGLQVSGDGGATWVGAAPVPVLPDGVEHCWTPDVVIDGQGTVHYLFVGLGGADRRPVGVYLTSSRDRARSFSPPIAVLGPLAYGVRMAVENRDRASSRLHLVWLAVGEAPMPSGFSSTDNRVMTAHSDDGARFSEPVVVSRPADKRPAGPAVAARPAGGVRVAYYDLQDDALDYEGRPGLAWEGSWKLLSSTVDRRGQPAAPEVVDDAVVPPFRVTSIFTMAPPALAVSAEKACLAWSDARHGDADVLVRCSVDDQPWMAPARANDDALGNGYWQYLPYASIASNGRVDVVFYDRREYRRNHLNFVGFAYSYDGRRFSNNVTLAKLPSNPLVGVAAEGTGLVDPGSQLAVLSRPASALTAWADSRNGGEDLVAQDVYAAEATQLIASERPLWAVPLGMVVLVGGLAAVPAVRRRSAL